MRLIFFCLAVFHFLVFAFWPQPSLAQISAEGAAWVGETNYAQSANDAVFCFSPQSDISLTFSVAGGAGNYTFTWYRYEATGNNWDTQLSVSTGASSSISGLLPGGYRVVAGNSDGSVAAQARCWAFKPQLSEPQIEIAYSDCFSVELQASSDSVPLIFYDPATGTSGYMSYGRVNTWSTRAAPQEQKTGIGVSMPAPFEDVTYVLTVSDRFGSSVETSTGYEAIAVEASFEAKVTKPDVLNELHTEVEGSAPIEVRFTDTSRGNITGWEWTFGSSGRAAEPDPFFVFTQAGRDSVVLRVVNRNSGCEDFSDPLMISVRESFLDAPNVFTPNDDGVNDEFRVAYRSIKKFEMVIYNRWGRKVFQTSDPSKGWDGKIGNTMASPGVYYYYIEGRGYNPDEVHKLHGPVHLIRGKN